MAKFLFVKIVNNDYLYRCKELRVKPITWNYE